MAKDFYTAVEGRRSIYGISKEVSISDDKIKEIIEFALKHTPSSFNSQTARIVLLLGEQHDKLWNLTEAALRKVVGDNNFAPTEEKMKSFRNGYGTVLFFEDQQVVEQLQKDFALYKDNFPIWSQQSSGMHQFVIWTALEMEGLGATLQHYNPLIDEDVRKEWNTPAHWKLIAQMPFGQPTMAPNEKEFKPLDERFKTFK
ncbi:nitroreductase family protein [Brevibacillus sp. 7WMA2]|uniref:Nitroreductase family protein n=1 Tax=Brevibacillus laterosporus LMG 15441 TaxID=1042163 RepID=A0A075R7Z1_BRELA|nr:MULTISPECIES: nitroreductase family protein [Brevibacillus]HAS00672.1 nitroreductase [Brevibacillus sp.]AIG25685.1 nitroreductase family protein [Brevibacillus laterosporus LMG 15441]AUM64231.1 nitroreductase [Brevibacillus laterosporus]AYK07217.1 nitroreductase family protein [Brevibacillus laterosporus]ERM17270.1 nitroreductase [Brevibacillus laterosporus PE36]